MKQMNIQDSVIRYIEGLGTLDADRIVSGFADDVVIHYPGMKKMDREDFRTYINQLKTIVSRVTFTPKEVFTTEHGNAAQWNLMLHFKNGRSVQIDGIDSWVIGTNGEIQRMDVYYDPAPIHAALKE